MRDENGDDVINSDEDTENFVKNQMASVLTSPGSDHVNQSSSISDYHDTLITTEDGHHNMAFTYIVKKSARI